LVTSAVAIPLVLALHAADAPLAASAALCRVPIQRLPADGADDFFDGHLTPPLLAAEDAGDHELHEFDCLGERERMRSRAEETAVPVAEGRGLWAGAVYRGVPSRPLGVGIGGTNRSLMMTPAVSSACC
jgi:hypothetical protein